MTESLTALAATGTARPAAADAVVEGLVREHLPLVGFAVGEVIGRVPAHVRRDDLVSAGQFALFTAAKGYDPGLGVPFAAFALRRVRGAVIDELRRTDWASRSVRRRAREAQTARDALAAQLGRVPTERETAESMGVPVAELRGLGSDVARAAVLSIQGLGDPEVLSRLVGDDVDGPEGALLARERLGYLQDAVTALPDRLRHIITAYYLEGRTMVQISADLGVSESRVSQLCTEALRLMRLAMTAALEPDAVAPAGEGCVARRQRAYVDAAMSQRDVRSRLGRPVTARRAVVPA